MSNPEGRRTPLHTGGCQCGAVRFAVYAEPIKIGICHCRMCQKAVAGPFARPRRGAVDRVRLDARHAVELSLLLAGMRDFCAACGTPLSYRHPDGPIIELLTGAFDAPQRRAAYLRHRHRVGACVAGASRCSARQGHARDYGSGEAPRPRRLSAPRPRYRRRLEAAAIGEGDENQAAPRQSVLDQRGSRRLGRPRLGGRGMTQHPGSPPP